MRSLLRLLIAVILLGSAIQQGWLQAATGFVVESLGGPAAAGVPVVRLDLGMLLQRLTDAVLTLPDPWYSLALVISGIIGLVFAASVISGLVRAATLLTGWLRDAFV